MTFSTRPFLILVFLPSLAGTAVAEHTRGYSSDPGYSGGFPPRAAPEIDAGSAVSAVGLLIGVGALLAERLRGK